MESHLIWWVSIGWKHHVDLGFYNGMVIECHVLFEMTCDIGSRIGKRGWACEQVVFLEVVFGNMVPSIKTVFLWCIQFLRSALGFIGDVVCQLWIEKRTAPKDTQNFSDGCFFLFLSQNAEIGIRKIAGCCMTKQKLVQSEIQCVLGCCESTRHMTRI